MAKVLDKFQRDHLRRSYPWTAWADGNVWQIKRNKDFVIATSSFVSMLYKNASRWGKRVEVMVRGDTITFRFHEESHGSDEIPKVRLVWQKYRIDESRIDEHHEPEPVDGECLESVRLVVSA